jgi:hypothetical protein
MFHALPITPGSSEEYSAYISERREVDKEIYLHEGCDEDCTHLADDEEDSE